MSLREDRFSPSNGEGWRLDLRRVYDPARLDQSQPPVVLIPGYGMNAHVLGYHPEGLSMMASLATRGFEVWAANLRGQGDSERGPGGARRVGFREAALVDLPASLAEVRARTLTHDKRLHAIGCSLGATYLYAFLAHNRTTHGLASMTSIGGPFRWEKVHPLVKVAFRSPSLAGAVRLRGTRRLARAVLPVARRMPGLLSLYMNASIIDLANAADELVKTVEDPHPHLNRQLAHWIRGQDLVVDGLHVTRALDGLETPVLCVLANADGVVPEETVLSIQQVAPRTDVLRVGDAEEWFAHADLFVSRNARQRVFEPLADWLLLQGPAGAKD